MPKAVIKSRIKILVLSNRDDSPAAMGPVREDWWRTFKDPNVPWALYKG